MPPYPGDLPTIPARPQRLVTASVAGAAYGSAARYDRAGGSHATAIRAPVFRPVILLIARLADWTGLGNERDRDRDLTTF